MDVVGLVVCVLCGLCCLLVVWIVGAALTLCLAVYCDSVGCLDGVVDSDWF